MSDQVKKTSASTVVWFTEKLVDEWSEKLFKDPLLHEKFGEFFVKFDGHVLASVIEAVRSLPVYEELPTFEVEYDSHYFVDSFEDFLFDSLANKFSAKTGVKVTYAPYPEGFER